MILAENMRIKNRYDGQIYRIIQVLDYTVLVEKDKSITEMSKSDIAKVEGD